MNSRSCIATVCLLVISLQVALTQEPFNGKIWAVLVAGSNGYFNYRHQADVCHAYQVLKAHGLPDEQIIVMMYDDIANDPSNPTPGVIINQPKGKDVYKGVPKDYVGEEVNPKNFLSVLLGDKTLESKGKKVLKSTADDHVFIFFADHGAPGLIAFPTDELEARPLIKTLNQMHAKKMYKRLVFYMEACESGSMFDKLLAKDKNIYAVTAANPDESSYACYWDEKIGTYLGDVFSVKWIEESDKRANLDSETVAQQRAYLVKATNTSHVCQYGDVEVAAEPLGHFQGEKVAPSPPHLSRPAPIRDVVPSPDVPVETARRLIALAKDADERVRREAVYTAMLSARNFLNASVSSLARQLQSHLAVNENLMLKQQQITHFDCYESLVAKFKAHCFDISKHTYALRFLYVLVNACETLPEHSQESINRLSEVVENHCRSSGTNQSVFSSIL